MREIFIALVVIACCLLFAVFVAFSIAFMEDYQDEIRDKIFSRKKPKKPLNTDPYCAPLPPKKSKHDNLPHNLECRVCGYKFAALANNRYTIKDGSGFKDAFDCPMCGCQTAVNRRYPAGEIPRSIKITERQADTDAPTSEI